MRISDWSSDVCSSDLFPIDARRYLVRGLALSADRADRGGDHVRYAAAAAVLPAGRRAVDPRADRVVGILRTGAAPRGRDRGELDPFPRSDPRAPPRDRRADRKSTRLTPVTNAQLVCRLLLDK